MSTETTFSLSKSKVHLSETMDPLPKKNRIGKSTLDTPELICEVKFKEIVQQEQEIRESGILEKYVESGWRQYCDGLRVCDEEKKYYYRQFLLGRGELCTNAIPTLDVSHEDVRQEYNADIEEAKQVAFLFLAAPHDGYDTEQRKSEIHNFRELYASAFQCGGNVGYEAMVYKKEELLHQVTTFIEKHRKKGRIVILFVGHGEPDTQISLAGGNCPLQEYIDSVDEVVSNLDPPVPIDLINAQCYAHLVPTAKSPFVNIIHFTTIENPQTHSFYENKTVSGKRHRNSFIVELQKFGETSGSKQDVYAGKKPPTNGTTQLTARGFAPALFPDTIDERFKCKTCKLVLRDAVQAPCGHRHCKTCLDDFIRSSGDRLCPACPEGAEGGENKIFLDKGMKMDMNTLRIVCNQSGCGWRGCLREYQENHEMSCRSRQPTTPDAEPRVRSDRGAESGEQRMFTVTSLKQPDRQKQSAVPECVMQEEKELIRAFKRATTSTLGEVYKESHVANWEITNFFRKLEESKSGRLASLDSPPFYTSRGYKMCCRIYLNGSETGKGTHISIYFVLMPGQFDDRLHWPFNQNMSITLFDQKDTDPSDITNNFIADPTSDSSRRPISDMQVVAGDPQFVPHRDLYQHTKTAYVKNDVMILRPAVS